MSDPIEIIIEPDVVPRGTVDLKGLDAPPGTPPPKVRVTRTGLVVPLGAPSRGPQPDDELSDSEAPVLTPEVMSEVREAVRDAIEREVGADSAAALVPEEVAEPEREEVQAAAAPVPDFDPAPFDPAPQGSDWEPPPGFQLEPPPAAADVTGTPDYAALDAAAQAPMPSRPESAGEPVLAGVGKAEPEFDPRFDTNIGGPGSIFDVVKVLAYLLLLFGGIGILGMWMTNTLPTSTSTVAEKTPERVKVDVTSTQPEVATVDKTIEEPPPAKTTKTIEEPPPAKTIDEPPPAKTAKTIEEPPPAKTADEPPPAKTAEKPPTKPIEKPPVKAPEPPPESELDVLRKLAGKTKTGVEVGVERDPVEQRIADLREQANRALDGGDLAAAKQALTELLKHDPDDPEGLLQLGYVHHQEGNLTEAIGHYRRSAAQAPNDPRPWNNLFLAHDARGETAEAKKSLKTALQLGPENPDVLVNLANFVSRRSPRRAHPLLDKALAQNPEHGPARLARGAVRERLGDASGAKEDYRLLLKSKQPRYRPRALDGLGRLARKGGKAKTAIDLHQRALKGDPTLHSARVGLGLAQIEAGDLTGATQTLLEATQKLPKSAAAWRALGVAYARQGSEASYFLVKAKEAYEQAVRLKPTDWQSRYNYALLAEQAGNFPVAITQFEKAIQLEPKAWEPYVRLARLYADTDRGQKALGYIDTALKHRPEEPELHLHRARLLAGQDRRIEARSALRDFVRNASPDDPRLERIRKGLQ